MFKLAGEGVHNDFPSDKCCAHQQVLQVEAVHRRIAGNWKPFLRNKKDKHVCNKIFYRYNRKVSRGGIQNKSISH